MIFPVYCNFLDPVLLWVVTIRFVIFCPDFLNVERTSGVKLYVNAVSFSCLASGNYVGYSTVKMEFSLGFLPIPKCPHYVSYF